MRTRRLGSSDLEVTVVGLGCNNFGGRIDEEASRAVIDAALEAGVTFFDTADVYGTGWSEEIGRALAAARPGGARDEFGHDLGDGEGPWLRPASATRSRRRCDGCRPDWIDLYQYHRPVV
jgi:aryl-alcohol dehydrogenase-like predicted oxidoreductase